MTCLCLMIRHSLRCELVTKKLIYLASQRCDIWAQSYKSNLNSSSGFTSHPSERLVVRKNVSNQIFL
jgi:hypothetical protein